MMKTTTHSYSAQCNCESQFLSDLKGMGAYIYWCKDCKLFYDGYQDSEFNYHWNKRSAQSNPVMIAKPEYIISSPEAPEDTYKTCYWKYIDAKTWDDAKYWLGQMQSKVTLDMEPELDGKSWSLNKPGSMANIEVSSPVKADGSWWRFYTVFTICCVLLALIVVSHL
jgi:hypothetical protein